jgi:hypothetical protein
MTKGWERITTYETRCSWTTQDAKLVKQGRLQAERKDHHKSSTLHHIVPSHSNDEAFTTNTEQRGRTRQEEWTYQTKIKLKTKTGFVEEGGTTIGSTTNRGATTRILTFKSETREDACLSLAEGIMTLRRPTTTLTIDSQPLERQMLPHKVCYKIIHNGR